MSERVLTGLRVLLGSRYVETKPKFQPCALLALGFSALTLAKFLFCLIYRHGTNSEVMRQLILSQEIVNAKGLLPQPLSSISGITTLPLWLPRSTESVIHSHSFIQQHLPDPQLVTGEEVLGSVHRGSSRPSQVLLHRDAKTQDTQNTNSRGSHV